MGFQQQVRNRVRLFNKHILNRVTRRFADASRGPFAVIYHTGRRSGKAHETTIMAAPLTDGFVIALTYGPDVDWYRNVLAAGHCKLLWHGDVYDIQALEPMDANIAMPAFPLPLSVILKRLHTKEFVKMTYNV